MQMAISSQTQKTTKKTNPSYIHPPPTNQFTDMILLPNNNFGALIMLAIILLIIVVPLAVVGWIVSLFAPWWVALPCGALASLLAFIKTVKFR